MHHTEDLLEEELRSDEVQPSHFIGAKTTASATNGNLNNTHSMYMERHDIGNPKRLYGNDDDDDLELSHSLLDSRDNKMSNRFSARNYELDDDQQALLNDL